MKCVSCDICVYHLWFVFFFLWGIPQLQSDWSLSCDHGLDYASKCEKTTTTTTRCWRAELGMRHADLQREATAVIAKPESALLYVTTAVWSLVWVCGCVLSGGMNDAMG